MKHVKVPIVVDARFTRKGNVAPLMFTVKEHPSQLEVWFGIKNGGEVSFVVFAMAKSVKRKQSGVDITEFLLNCHIDTRPDKKYTATLYFYHKKLNWELIVFEPIV